MPDITSLFLPLAKGILFTGAAVFLAVAAVRGVLRSFVADAKEKPWYGPGLRSIGIVLGALLGVVGRAELFGEISPLISGIAGAAAGYFCRHLWDVLQSRLPLGKPKGGEGA